MYEKEPRRGEMTYFHHKGKRCDTNIPKSQASGPVKDSVSTGLGCQNDRVIMGLGRHRFLLIGNGYEAGKKMRENNIDLLPCVTSFCCIKILDSSVG